MTVEVTCPQCGDEHDFDDNFINYHKCECGMIYDNITKDWYFYDEINEPPDPSYKCECPAEKHGGKHSHWCPASQKEE